MRVNSSCGSAARMAGMCCVLRTAAYSSAVYFFFRGVRAGSATNLHVPWNVMEPVNLTRVGNFTAHPARRPHSSQYTHAERRCIVPDPAQTAKATDLPSVAVEREAVGAARGG